MKLKGVFFTAVFLFVSTAMAAILVCRECGYENPETNQICSHCKAKLPAVKPAPAPDSGSAEGVNASGKVTYISPSVVEQEIDLGQRHLDSGEFDLANLFFKNAASLEILTDPKQKAGRSATIIELRKKSETGGMTVQRKCPECGGTGKHVMEAAGMDNKVTTIEVAGKSCQRCGGTGNIMKPTTMDERRGKIGRAINKYTAIQQGRKYMPVGGAWVPSDLDGKLGVKQTVMLRRSAAPPCSECMGLGRVDCSKCNGMGEIKCTASGCINGIVESIDEGGLIKNKVKVKKKSKCRTCTGTGFVTCLSCRGKGNMVCKKCNSSGERQACTRCGGQGFTECRRCRGSGKTEKEAVCSECRGEGVELCSSCGGDGKKK